MPDFSASSPRRPFGVVAVIVRDGRFLLIRRSQRVVAPGLVCFAGGGVDPGESEQEALVREMQEELNVDVNPINRVWESISRSGSVLGWWLAEIKDHQNPDPNANEVAEIFWLTADEILQRDDLLESMPLFFAAVGRGEVPLQI